MELYKTGNRYQLLSCDNSTKFKNKPGFLHQVGREIDVISFNTIKTLNIALMG